MNPIVIAYHLIWTAYGVWLPNDPRGSSSLRIAADVLKPLGDLHRGRKKIQPAGSIIRDFHRNANPLLKHAAMSFTAPMVAAIAAGFAAAIEEQKYTCYACAIMPDHVHLVIRKHKHLAEEMIARLQSSSYTSLIRSGLVDVEHPVWGGHGWKVFLGTPDDIWRTIGYVQDNPLPLGLLRRTWSFVTPYNNWPLHEGHNPNSPYARRLRGI